ncbi:hypothetical protein ACLIBG_00430 [Virgibacillus sp. W0181]|uniref:alpha/beta hydrolase family protein n=1 Tax=Virgibacillus sp. W0181 TaxID=3391581 RepID=UPI003F485650
MKHILRNVVRWIKIRLSHIPERDNYFSAWVIFILWVATTITAITLAAGNPTGASLISYVIDLGKAVGLNLFLFPIVTLVLSALFACLYLPIPRLCTGSFIYTVIVHITILICANSGTLFSYMVGIGYSTAVLLIGILLIMLMHKKVGRVSLLVMLALIVIVNYMYLSTDTFDSQHTLQMDTEDATPIMEENPAEPGNYDYTFFTYGSGEDLHRETFGHEVSEVTRSVDASHWITKWDEKRKDFWGFDPSNFPINGRAWLPEGDGPFPIILMVHGNHTMENFSTSGYDYLGELLASRGFIAISVDEDFVNYSNVSGSPNDNYKLRAWLILQHIAELQHMNLSPENALYKKIDFDQVAFMGHSRGGQAALMAADYTTFFEDESLLESMDAITIKGVIAIAPTDKTIDGKKPHLHNISCLLLGGARDADVSDFRGNEQFYRSTFDTVDDGFKTTLYIADANHTQFNTSWGKMDLSIPRGLFLNQRQTMSSEDQQQITKVYMASFLESVFHNKQSYNKLFEDYRYGSKWLPDTTLVNKYRDAAYTPIIQFQQDKNETIDLEGFKKWEVKTPEDRRGNDHLTDALLLEWDTDATYTVDLSNEDLITYSHRLPEQFVLTMANMDSEADGERVPDIEVEIETMEGVRVQLPLDEFLPFPPVISTNYTIFGLFENTFRDGKYEPSWEPIFQTFPIPIEAFEKHDTAFDGKNIKKLTLHFKTPPGKIFVKEIGVR